MEAAQGILLVVSRMMEEKKHKPKAKAA